MSEAYPPARRVLAAGLLTTAILASPASAGEAVTLPGPRVTLYKDADCFARGADVPVAQLGAVTRESPADAACVKLKAADGKSYFVLPSAIKAPAGCTPRRAASGPQARTFGSQGASSCARD